MPSHPVRGEKASWRGGTSSAGAILMASLRAGIPVLDRPPPPAAVPTKIAVPEVAHWAIPRDRLCARLAAGVRNPLTVVTGPPGAGKTAALTAWAHSGRHYGPIAWVSLEPADHRSELFWPQVVAALEHAGVSGLPDPRSGVLRTALASALADRDEPVVLVLDDFHPDSGSGLAGELGEVLRNAGPHL